MLPIPACAAGNPLTVFRTRVVEPALRQLRRRHVEDDDEYYLDDADADHLLAFERNGYTVVTNSASRLPRDRRHHRHLRVESPGKSQRCDVAAAAARKVMRANGR